MKCECRQVPTGVICPSTRIREMETVECDSCIERRKWDSDEECLEE